MADPAAGRGGGRPGRPAPAAFRDGERRRRPDRDRRRRTRAGPGIPVVSGTVDAFASYLGAGPLEPGDAYDPGGSAGGFGVYWDRAARASRAGSSRRRRWPAASASGRRWPPRAGRSTGTATTSWAGRSRPRRSSAEAAATPPGADGLVFLPYLAGERSPIWDPEARGVLAGLTLGHGRGHIARAIVEASALAIRHVAAPMLTAGVEVTAMRVCGGPARSRFWNGVKADVTGFPVLVPEVLETAVLGSAIVGGGRDRCPAGPADRDQRDDPHHRADRAAPRPRARLRPAVRGIPGALSGDGAAPAAAERRRQRRMTVTATRADPHGAASDLADLSFAFPTRAGGTLPVLDGIDLDRPGRRDRRAHRPERLRQVHAPARHRRPARTGQRRGPARRRRRSSGPDPRIGLVFQEPRLLPWRSAADNIAYPLELAGWSPERRAARVATLIELVGLDPAVADSRPSELSGGTAPAGRARPRAGARARRPPPRRAVQRARCAQPRTLRPRAAAPLGPGRDDDRDGHPQHPRGDPGRRPRRRPLAATRSRRRRHPGRPAAAADDRRPRRAGRHRGPAREIRAHLGDPEARARPCRRRRRGDRAGVSAELVS